MVANRLGMRYRKKLHITNDENTGQRWGVFSFVFALRFIEFVRKNLDHFPVKPSNKDTDRIHTLKTINMPTKEMLMKSEEGMLLKEQIVKYGGYENVARRLGLNF